MACKRITNRGTVVPNSSLSLPDFLALPLFKFVCAVHGTTLFFQVNHESSLKYFCLRFLELNREMQYKVNNRRLTKYCWRGVPMISMYLSGASRSFGKTWILLAPLNFFMWAKLEACLPIKGPANLDGKVRWILTGTWRKKKRKIKIGTSHLLYSQNEQNQTFFLPQVHLEHTREDLLINHFTFACNLLA